MFIELQNSVKEQFPCHFWFPRYEIVGRERVFVLRCGIYNFSQILRSWFLLSRSTLVLLHLLRILYSLNNFFGYLNFFAVWFVCLWMKRIETIFDCFLTVLIHPNITQTHTQTLIQLTEIEMEKLLFSVDQMMKRLILRVESQNIRTLKRHKWGEKRSQLWFIYYLFSNTEGSEGER